MAVLFNFAGVIVGCKALFYRLRVLYRLSHSNPPNLSLYLFSHADTRSKNHRSVSPIPQAVLSHTDIDNRAVLWYHMSINFGRLTHEQKRDCRVL